jgi:hypothetical protein
LYYSDTLSPFIENILTGFPFAPMDEEKQELKRLTELLRDASDYNWPSGTFVFDSESPLPYGYVLRDSQKFEALFSKSLKKEKLSATNRQEQKEKCDRLINSLRKAIILFYREYKIRKERTFEASSVVGKIQEANDGLLKSELEALLLATQDVVRYIAVLEIEAAVYGKSQFPPRLSSSRSASALEVEITIKIGRSLKERKESLGPNCLNHKTLDYQSFDELYMDVGQGLNISKQSAGKALRKTEVHVRGKQGQDTVATGALEATISNCIDFYEKSIAPK